MPVDWFEISGAATDWTVVRVVVTERRDGAGEEKVLFRSPSVLAAVPDVPAPECPVSDMAVSAVVPKVGARVLECIWLSWEIETECLLCDSELCRDL